MRLCQGGLVLALIVAVLALVSHGSLGASATASELTPPDSNGFISPDGTRFVIIGPDSAARIWETSSGRLLRTLRLAGQIESVSFSPDGARILTTTNGAVQLWDASTGRLLHSLPTSGAPSFSADGRRILTLGSEPKVWDVASGRLLRTLRIHLRDYGEVILSANGERLLTDRLAVSDLTDTLRIWDVESDRQLQTLHVGETDSITLSPIGDRVLTTNGTVARLWDATTGRMLHAFPDDTDIAAFSPDEKLILTGNGVLREAASGRPLHTLLEADGESMAFSPDGKHILIVGDVAQVWDVATGTLLKTLKPAPGPALFGDFTASIGSNGLVVSSTGDGTIELWQAATGKLERTLRTPYPVPCAGRRHAGNSTKPSLSFVTPHGIALATLSGHVMPLLRDSTSYRSYDPAWSSDGRCLAFTQRFRPDSGNGSADVLVRRGARQFSVAGSTGSSFAGSPSWSPDGRRLALIAYASSSGGALVVEQPGTTIEFDISSEDAFDDTPAWSPNGSWIAFTHLAHYQQPGYLYAVRPDGTGLRRLTSTRGENPTWSPDSKEIAFDDGHRIAIVRLDSRRMRYLTSGTSADRDPAWSRDGRTIAFARAQSPKTTKSDVWLMRPDGSHQRFFKRNASEPAWRPR